MEVNDAFLIDEEQPGLEESKPLHSSQPTLKRWLREPLLHFLALGFVLFVVYAYINRGRVGPESSKQIPISLDDLRTMEAYFESQWHRPPTPQEFQAMVEDKVREEVLYREGLAMGLDPPDVGFRDPRDLGTLPAVDHRVWLGTLPLP